jgi:hypothetical protein
MRIRLESPLPSEPRQAGEQQPGALPAALLCELSMYFSPMRLRYISEVLSPDELRVIRDIRDALIIARIKRMSEDRLRRFDRYRPAGKHEHTIYEQAQLQWLYDEQYLLGLRLGRSPSHHELLADFAKHQNGLRFRAYYALKHPGRMSAVGGD